MGNTSDMTTASMLLERWSIFLSRRHQALHHDDIEVIHDLRVATRRLRAAVKLFAPFCSTEDLDSVYPLIKSITQEVGQLRNLDETLLFTQSYFSGRNDESLLAPAKQSLQTLRKLEADKVRKQLKQLEIKSIQKTFEHISRHLPMSPFSTVDCSSGHKLINYLSDYNLMLFNQVHDNIEPASAPEAVEQRHRLRIAIKKWRYCLEIMAELSAKDYSAVLSLLKFYQGMLGTLNDLSVFYELLKNAGLSPKAQSRVKQVTDKLAEELYFNFIHALKHQPIRYEFLI